MVIFALVVGICFAAAVAGFRIFAQTNSRQSLQRDARAIFAWLQRDVGLSNLVRCRTRSRVAGGEHRDLLAVAALDSWQQPLSVDPLGLPAWDRLVVYEATQNSQGYMIRHLFRPMTGVAVPLQPESVTAMLDAFEVPGALDPVDQRRLSSSVRSFRVELSEARNTAVFGLVLSEATVEGGSGGSRNEVLEVQTTIFPRNTWPRL